MTPICPYKVTNTFHRNIRTRFFVPNPGRTIELIQRQFKAGRYQRIAEDQYEVKIKDIPALVVMRDATLITVREMGLVA